VAGIVALRALPNACPAPIDQCLPSGESSGDCRYALKVPSPDKLVNSLPGPFRRAVSRGSSGPCRTCESTKVDARYRLRTDQLFAPEIV
jgi:hypothetical protein